MSFFRVDLFSWNLLGLIMWTMRASVKCLLGSIPTSQTLMIFSTRKKRSWRCYDCHAENVSYMGCYTRYSESNNCSRSCYQHSDAWPLFNITYTSVFVCLWCTVYAARSQHRKCLDYQHSYTGILCSGPSPVFCRRTSRIHSSKRSDLLTLRNRLRLGSFVPPISCVPAVSIFCSCRGVSHRYRGTSMQRQTNGGPLSHRIKTHIRSSWSLLHL